jgi:hypothetical protein
MLFQPLGFDRDECKRIDSVLSPAGHRSPFSWWEMGDITEEDFKLIEGRSRDDVGIVLFKGLGSRVHELIEHNDKIILVLDGEGFKQVPSLTEFGKRVLEVLNNNYFK